MQPFHNSNSMSEIVPLDTEEVAKAQYQAKNADYHPKRKRKAITDAIAEIQYQPQLKRTATTLHNYLLVMEQRVTQIMRYQLETESRHKRALVELAQVIDKNKRDADKKYEALLLLVQPPPPLEKIIDS